MQFRCVTRVAPVLGRGLAVALAVAMIPVANGQLRLLPQLSGEALPRIELAPPQLPLVSGAAAARLQQLPTLVASENWDDAVDVMNDVVQPEAGHVVSIDDRLFTNVGNYRNREIAGWPAAGLARYRSRVDARAERRYREGLAARDEQSLADAVDDAMCSSWGDDVLFALGELALERGDYAAARRYWSQILPGQDAQGALAHYPDTNLDPATIRARLVLVSIREGDFDRAHQELADLRRLHPQATGRLGGKATPFAPALEQLLAAAREWPSQPTANVWPTFAGTNERNHILPALGAIAGPAWADPVLLASGSGGFPSGNNGLTVVEQRLSLDSANQQPRQPALAYYPAAANGRVYFARASRIYAVDVADGRPAITESGVIYDARELAAPSEIDGDVSISAGAPVYSLSLIDDILYARLGPAETSRVPGRVIDRAARIVGLSLPRDGLLVFSAQPDNKSWAFDGVPVGDRRQLYVALRQSDVNPRAAVACFDATTGRERWRTSIASANTAAAGFIDEITHNLLTLVGDRVFFQSNLGVVASLRASDGEIEWLRIYPRGGDSSPSPPCPALYDRGRLFVSPGDSNRVFAIDAETGREWWSSDQLAGTRYLLGVADETLICAGERLYVVDNTTGNIKKSWPPDDRAAAAGRGLVTGHEVFYPTEREIQVIDLRTGQPSRPPISLASVGGHGANLIVADNYLIAAGPDRMMAYKIRPAPLDQ